MGCSLGQPLQLQKHWKFEQAANSYRNGRTNMDSSFSAGIVRFALPGHPISRRAHLVPVLIPAPCDTLRPGLARHEMIRAAEMREVKYSPLP